MPLVTDAGTLKIIACVGVVGEGKILVVEYEPSRIPRKKGWWIPAPEVQYGEHPDAVVEGALEGLGFGGMPHALVGIESFVRGTGWHLIFHYRAEVHRDAQPSSDYRSHAWFRMDNLPPAQQFAQGQWERELALVHLRACVPPVSRQA